MTDLHTVLPPPGRVNGTPLYNDHPDDHNVVVDAINALHAGFLTYQDTIHLVVYPDLATMYADASQPEGTLGWALGAYGSAYAALAVYDPNTFGWVIITEPMHLFTPRAWIGGTELTLVPTTGYQSKMRQDFGYCWFMIRARFGGLNTISGSGVFAVMPPIAPTTVGAGPFQMAYCVVPTLGAIGGIAGAFDGNNVSVPALPGASVPGHLACVMPGGGGLMDRGDMGPGTPGGQFDVFMSGFYPILGFVV